MSLFILSITILLFYQFRELICESFGDMFGANQASYYTKLAASSYTATLFFACFCCFDCRYVNWHNFWDIFSANQASQVSISS